MATSDYISIVALIISVIALIYTIKTYLLKEGEDISGRCSIGRDPEFEDKYIHSIVLENKKDRAVIIFRIYIKLDDRYYLELDNFESEPLILKPFEVFRKKYDPVYAYNVNTKKYNFNRLFDIDLEKKIILCTSKGKYVVKESIIYWDPMLLNFKEPNSVEIVQPIRERYEEMD